MKTMAARMADWLKEWRRCNWDWYAFDNPPDSPVFIIGGTYPPLRRRLEAIKTFCAASWRSTFLALVVAVVGAVAGAIATKLLG